MSVIFFIGMNQSELNMQCTSLAGKMIPWRQLQNAVKNKTNKKYGKMKIYAYRSFCLFVFIVERESIMEKCRE